MALRSQHAIWDPLGPQREPKMVAHDILCFHTMAGYLFSTNEMFHRDGYGGTESHWGVGGKWGSDVTGGRRWDGRLVQWQDAMYQADANLDGNDRVLSVETADNAVRPIQPWTSRQLDTLVKLAVEVCSLEFHKYCPTSWRCRQGVTWSGMKVAIPPVMIPDTRGDRRGLAVHRQGCEHSLGVGKVEGYLMPGCERWSTARGKDCPTDARVAQVHEIIVPRVQRGLLQMREEAEMPTTDQVVQGWLDKRINLTDSRGDKSTPELELVLTQTFRYVQDVYDWKEREAAAMSRQIEALGSQVKTLTETVERLVANMTPATPTTPSE